MSKREPNTTIWNIGDIVIHSADAKKPEMLMKVIGFGKDGLVKTIYKTSYPMNGGCQEVWENYMKHLHDPNKFGISTN